MKKIVLLTMASIACLQAVTVTTNKTVYSTNEKATVSFKDMKAKNHDWIGIYRAGTSNAWGNVVQWTWTHEVKQGSHTFAKLPAGDYEARVFFDNSFHTEAKKAFHVKGNIHNRTIITTNKSTYSINEKPTINFKGMKAISHDWIGIYPVGTSNAWENVVQWTWTHEEKQGTHTFAKLPSGNYEARAFFDNSYKTAAKSKPFSVKGEGNSLTLKADVWQGDLPLVVRINYKNMVQHKKNWIGIYPVGTSNAWKNLISWSWADANKKHIDFGSSWGGMHGNCVEVNLPAGNYEARAFYNNSFNLERKVAFTVKEKDTLCINQNDLD